ncbi:MAG: hypothetical protein QF570_19380 [Myxococcota bacterium]|jgi:WD40 repeat protein|nr:hypothetical protein [Myxococcota bacterium]
MAGLAGAAGEASSASPLVAIRADHMVLDVALRGDRLLVATQSGRVEVYDALTGVAQPTLFSDAGSPERKFAPTVRSVAIAPDGEEVAVVTSEGLLHRYEFVPSSDSLETRLLGKRSIPGLMEARYLDAHRILLADMRGELALVDVDSGVEVYRRQLDYDPIYAIDLSPDGSRLAVAFRSSRVQIVEPVSGETQHVLKGHLDSVFGLAWLDDDQLATASKDKQLFAWDLRQADPRPRSLYRGDHYITALGADRAGSRLAIPLDGFEVGLVAFADGSIGSRLKGHTAPVHRLLFVDDGRKLVSAGYDARVFVWKLDSESESSTRR